MKVGIVTITNGENYGNRLQNYALQEYLKKYSIVSETIINNYYTNSYLLFFIKSKLRFLYKKVCNNNLSNRTINFYKFNKKIKFSKKILNNNKYPLNISKKYSYFIAGSDQIWNLNFPENNIIKFLGFVKENEKKISYAASFGSDSIPQKIDDKIPNWIKDIQFISVREDVGVKIVEKLTGRNDVEVLVDPTMLLTADEWDKVSKKPSQLKSEKYILNYFLGNLSKERIRIIDKFAKENNCDVINLLDKNNPLYSCGPSEFLYLEKNAFLICTDSFHSCVFSIIYNRPFVIFDREEKNMNNMGSRIDTLLDTFKLENRRYNGKNITSKNLNNDYNEAYKTLEKEREKSLNFLKKALNIK